MRLSSLGAGTAVKSYRRAWEIVTSDPSTSEDLRVQFKKTLADAEKKHAPKVVNNPCIMENVDPLTMDELKMIRSKMRSAAYGSNKKQGIDWEVMFKQYDSSGDGGLDIEELTMVVRKSLKINKIILKVRLCCNNNSEPQRERSEPQRNTHLLGSGFARSASLH